MERKERAGRKKIRKGVIIVRTKQKRGSKDEMLCSEKEREKSIIKEEERTEWDVEDGGDV